MECDRIKGIKEMIDIELSEKIMQKEENDPGLKVHDIAFRFASNKGDNYASDLFRVNVEYTRSNSNKKETKSIIIKVMPILEGTQKEMVKSSTLFSSEIKMLTNGLAKMNKLLSPGSPVSGRALYTQDDPAMLVVEDLAPLGFRMVDRISGLDEDHCLLAIRGLARFHASSVALCEKEPVHKEEYKYGFYHPDQTVFFKMFIKQMTKNVGLEMVKWPEVDPKLPPKIIELADKIYDKAIEVAKVIESEFNVINHGDAWVNNMLFKYNDKNKPTDHMFVDFQLCYYGSPAVDLLYFFNTSLNDETLIKNENKLLEEYLKVLSATLLELGCRTKPPTMSELKKSLTDRALLGMIATCVILPIILADKNADLVDNEFINAQETQTALCNGKLFRQAVIRRFPKFDKMGLFD